MMRTSITILDNADCIHIDSDDTDMMVNTVMMVTMMLMLRYRSH